MEVEPSESGLNHRLNFRFCLKKLLLINEKRHAFSNSKTAKKYWEFCIHNTHDK